jgi:hypothetical protein
VAARILSSPRADSPPSHAQTETTDDPRFSNPAGHIAEPEGSPHQVGVPLKRDAAYQAEHGATAASMAAEADTGAGAAPDAAAASGGVAGALHSVGQALGLSGKE